MDTTSIKILSLDAGGFRGLSMLYALEELMFQYNRRKQITNPADPPSHPYEIFDLICGSGTGGLIALMLGRLGMVWFPSNVTINVNVDN